MGPWRTSISRSPTVMVVEFTNIETSMKSHDVRKNAAKPIHTWKPLDCHAHASAAVSGMSTASMTKCLPRNHRLVITSPLGPRLISMPGGSATGGRCLGRGASAGDEAAGAPGAAPAAALDLRREIDEAAAGTAIGDLTGDVDTIGGDRRRTAGAAVVGVHEAVAGSYHSIHGDRLRGRALQASIAT
jgi:hypothetical protein